MTRQEFVERIVKPQLEHIEKSLASKGDEYAKDEDALVNFYGGVEISRTAKTPIEVLEGYRLKHDQSIKQMFDLLTKSDQHFITKNVNELSIKQKSNIKAMIDEKFGDEINYWILLKALLYDIYKI